MSSGGNSVSAENTAHQTTCPSGRCLEGATLLGIVGVNGEVGYITPRIVVDATFVARAEQQRKPETRFRFAEPCVEHECVHWTGNRCGLIHQVLDSPAAALRIMTQSKALPDCVIRRSCRWFAQVGARACAICPQVVHTPGSDSNNTIREENRQ
jgi:hypothetical protein